MAKVRTLQLYRGTTAQNNAYTGSAGELTMDTTSNELRLHDGFTVGGHIIGAGGSSAVDSVNGKTGVVVLTATDVGALPDSTVIPDAQIQSDWNQADNTKVDFIKNKPTIPAAQVNSDWNANSGVAQILNKPTLATIATSGSYNDLSDKPTIPTVGNGTITITQGGISRGAFTTNQSSNTTIALDAGGSGGYHPDLFDFKWADHILNDAQWLMANTFSWQYGSMYQAAYANLSAAITGKTLQSETVAGITVQFYLADDGHKICPASEESNVLAIYNKTGNAWYYIIDATNQRFKLPLANKDGFGPLLNYAERSDFSSGDVAPDDGWVMWNNSGTANASVDGVTVYIGGNDSANEGPAVLPVKKGSVVIITPDTGTPSFVPYIKNKATGQYKYLYFYVGAFTQTALENTAGLNTELFNQKADLNLSNVASNIDFVVESQEPTAENGYTWYRKYASGWVEQGGYTSMTDAAMTINLSIEMSDTNYCLLMYQEKSADGQNVPGLTAKTTTSFSINASSTANGSWQVSGMAAN